MQQIELPDTDESLIPEFVRSLPQDGDGSLAIFDADGTLWRDDVADDFTTWMIREGHVAHGDLWDEYIQIYRGDHAAGCRFLLNIYKGLSRAELHARIFEWWGSSAARNWVVEAISALRLLADRGYAIWVVTGSPTDTMLPLKEVLPVAEIVGMDFEFDDNDIITGRHAGISCADGGKADKVRELWGVGPIAFAAGNGSLDIAMMELAKVKWSVYPNPTFAAFSRGHGWPILPRPGDFVEEDKLA